jgi:hypothetical protein
VTPRDERVVAVRMRSKLSYERLGLLCTDGSIDRKTAGCAKRFECKPRPYAALRIGPGVQTVDLDWRYLILKWLEVFRIEACTCFALYGQSIANLRLLHMANDENGVVREIVLLLL